MSDDHAIDRRHGESSGLRHRRGGRRRAISLAAAVLLTFALAPTVDARATTTGPGFDTGADPEGLIPIQRQAAPAPPTAPEPATVRDPEGLLAHPSQICRPQGPTGLITPYRTTGRASYRLRRQPTTACPHDGASFVLAGHEVIVRASSGAWRYVDNRSTGRSGWVHRNGLQPPSAFANVFALSTADGATPDPEGLVTTPSVAEAEAPVFDPGPDPEGLQPIERHPEPVDCTPVGPDAEFAGYAVQARRSHTINPRPTAGCYTPERTIEIGDKATVLDERAGWVYLETEETGLAGWVRASTVERVPVAPEPAGPSSQGERIAGALGTIACAIVDVVSAYPGADASAYDLVTDFVAMKPCGPGTEHLRRCEVESGVTFSCDWANQEPYASRIKAWLARPDVRNGKSKAVDSSHAAVEAAYVNCLWIAANHGPDHWALGWNHGGCVSEERARP